MPFVVIITDIYGHQISFACAPPRDTLDGILSSHSCFMRFADLVIELNEINHHTVNELSHHRGIFVTRSR